MKMVEVKNLKKTFGPLSVLNDISFDVEKGDVISILGTSGSGKSTLLRSIIELEKIDSGSIIVEGDYLCKDGVYVPKKERRVILQKMGMVFQHFNLFPHMNIHDNLVCAPNLAKLDTKEEIERLVIENLNKVGLLDKINDYPSTLSGGQKQRAAIARALMLKPDIMLFDEPTSALDPELTNEVLNAIKALSENNITMLIVTHEIGFAREVSNKVLFMDGGYVIDYDSPEKVINNSNNDRIKSFIDKVL